jgi:hypothetical protein
MRKTFVATLVLALAGFAGNASAVLEVSGGCTSADSLSVRTWGDVAGEEEIVMNGPFFVEDGCILTILPGVIVRGQPRTAAIQEGVTAGTPGVLIVTQTGRLIANGNATNPIAMTTAAIDNNDDDVADGRGVVCPTCATPWSSGDTFLDDTPKTAPLAPLDGNGDGNLSLWGGLVVLGSAPTNNADKCGGVPYGECTVEGLTFPGFAATRAEYGGVLPHDNSGSLQYVSVRHAGDELGADNELNGISLGGVGDGTTIDHVEAYSNFDDGFEWFGGTVNGKHLVTAFVGDDMFDMDEGYTGVNQFLFGVMPFFNQNDTGPFGSASGDKACELDGDNYKPDDPLKLGNANTRINADNTVVDPTPWPFSNPAIYNMTIIGSTPPSGQHFTPTSVASDNLGIQVRQGFAGEIYNTIVVNTGSNAGLVIDTDTNENAPGFSAVENSVNSAIHPRTGGAISLVCSTLDDGAGLTADAQEIVDNGDALVTALGGGAASSNVIYGLFANLASEDTTFDPQGNASGKLDSTLVGSKIDPRPTGFVGIGGCPAPPAGMGLDPAATYRGAFPIGGKPWTAGWTVLGIAEMMVNN